MEKRKFKINILDFVIFVVILCSVAVLVFRDTVNEFFTKPEITTVEVTFFVNGADECAVINGSIDKTVIFVPDIKNDFQTNATVAELKAASDLHQTVQRGEAKIRFSGYKRLGRFYAEDGTRIYTDSECAIVVGSRRIVGTTLSVEISG